MAVLNPYANMDAQFLTVFVIVYAIMLIPAMLISLVMWVLNSLGMQKIAKRRGIPNGWLAWLPYGCNWILGAISDDYRLRVRNEERNRRGLLLGLSVATLVIAVLASTCLGVAPVLLGVDGTANGALVFLVFELLVLVVIYAVAIAYTVFMWICTFDLFRSCKPGSAVLFLILGLVLGLSPIFVFICSFSDDGMGEPA